MEWATDQRGQSQALAKKTLFKTPKSGWKPGLDNPGIDLKDWSRTTQELTTGRGGNLALELLSRHCGYWYQDTNHKFNVKSGVTKIVRKLSHGEKGQPFSTETTTSMAWIPAMALLGQEAQCPEVCYGEALTPSVTFNQPFTSVTRICTCPFPPTPALPSDAMASFEAHVCL